jgi:hypothetical protein
MINLRPVLALRGIFRALKFGLPAPALAFAPAYSFAFMQLFEKNKRPHELDPIFKRETKLKGHLKSKATKNYSKKLNTNVRKQKQKLKNHKGLLKRIKIVAMGLCRWVRAGTGSSSSNRRVLGTCTATRAEPT